MSLLSQDYEKICEIQLDGDIPLVKYRNRVTGLTINLAHIDSPIVKGDITFATEAFDDDGLPHTLEHLVFMGSEDYPYKGVLDLLANKCLASGTNAYTDTDHTNYTLSTAGNDGFLNLLPIYLEHLLFPTLTDAAYLTEVHHVNGDGEDAGIVYCEMQARENTGESRCMLEILRSLYPGHCGYKSETGGLMKNLRESTSNVKVRNYHKQFYHSRNLCITVTGPVAAKDIFEAIKPVEDKIVAKNAHTLEHTRPWQNPVLPLTSTTSRTISYSSDSDDDGLVFIAWRGPDAIKNYPEMCAIALMLDYLNDTPIAPIQRDFVECETPYCSSVGHSIVENSVSYFYIAFESVGKKYLHEVEKKLFALFDNIANGKESIDMNRMLTIVSRKIVRLLSVVETSPHSIVTSVVIGDFLYGNSVKDLDMRGHEVDILRSYESKDVQFWMELLKRYFCCSADIHHVCVVGVPSPDLMQSMSLEEKSRIEKQKIDLGGQLQVLAEQLSDAIKLNETTVPESLLNSVQVPSIDNIRFHPIERITDDKNKVAKFRFQYDSIKTNFVTCRLLIDTTHSLDKSDRLYLPLLADLLMETPVERNGQLVPYETIVSELYRDTISTGITIGVSSGGSFRPGLLGMLFCVAMQVEREKYQRMVEWYQELLFKTCFTPERIKTVATRMVSDIQQYKRKGSKVALCTMTSLCYQSDCNQWAVNFIRQQVFLKDLIARLEKTPQEVVKTLTQVRDKMARPENTLVHLTTNESKMNDVEIYKPWSEILFKSTINGDDELSKKKFDVASIKPCHELLSMVDDPEAAIVGVGSVETHYFEQIIPSLSSVTHPDVPALFTLLNYLTQLEGPLWRQLRGQGLTYHYDIRLSTSDGILTFLLAKSTHVVAAYKCAAEIVSRHVSGAEQFDESLLQSAKSTLIFELISAEKSPAGKSMQSLVAYLRNIGMDFNKKLIEQVLRVTHDDLRRVGPKYLEPLFAIKPGNDVANKRRSVVCCHPSKVDDVCSGFEPLGVHFSKISIENAPAFITAIE